MSDVIGRLFQGQRYVEFSGFYLFSCNNKEEFPNLYFLIDNYWLELTASDYVIEFGMSGGESICFLGITGQDNDYALFGDVFMRGYYSVHDIDNSRVGFAPYQGSYKSKIKAGTDPNKEMDAAFAEQGWLYHGNMWWNIIFGWAMIVPLCCCFLNLACCFTLCCTGADSSQFL